MGNQFSDTSPANPFSFANRFWSRVAKGDGCWLWHGTVGWQGYGVIIRNKRRLRAHRVSWEIANGPIPDGLCVLHRCDNPRCVNPAHLFLGTVLDNNADMHRKGRHAKGNHGKYGEGHGRAKLTDDSVRKLRRRRAAGERVSALAAEFGVSPAAVYFATQGSTWRHVG